MTANTKIMHSGYSTKVFGENFGVVTKNPLKVSVRSAARKLRGLDFDYIIMTGVSGITFGAALCYCMDKAPIVVRKTKESSHASYMVEGYPTNRDFSAIIVDDFVCTGDTIRRIDSEIVAHYKKMTSLEYDIRLPKFVGAYFYETGNYTDNLQKYIAVKKIGN
jgi:orotate phosphoribosyltransferase